MLTFTGVPNVASQDILEPNAPPRAKRSETDIVSLRPMVWRVICGALPLDTSKWESTMQEHYKTYEDFKKELIVQPKLKAEEEKKEQLAAIVDHPLSTSQSSVWNTFFKDQELWDEIEKDVKRTRREMNYFYRAVDETLNTP